MSEEEEIRQAVIELLEAQESGEDISGLLPQFDESSAAFVAAQLPHDGQGEQDDGANGFASAASNETPEVDTPEARAAALANALDAVRAYSQASRLLTPADWETSGVVPSFMTCEDLEMAVYDRLMEYQQACNLDPTLAPLSSDDVAAGDASTSAAAHTTARAATSDTRSNPHTRSHFSSSPGRSVGMSGFKRRATSVATDPAAANNPEPAPETASMADPEPASAPEPATEPTFEEPTADISAQATPDPAPDPAADFPECADIRLLMGKNSYYLYDARVMTDTYARWSYLAAEDDPVAAFIECVRDESRTYPRPMAITNLANPPFLMNADAVETAFATARQQGRADDIERIKATNGDVYFYSTAYLTPTRAQSLAQYDVVERAFNV